MSIAAYNVGRAFESVRATLDQRWAMAYAAGVGDGTPVLFDTTASPLPVHPLFPMSPNWALLASTIAASGLWDPDDALLGVHATESLVLHRPLMAPTTFALEAEVVGVEDRRSGAYQVIRYRARDSASGEPLWTNWTGSIFRGVAVDGEPVPVPGLPPAIDVARAQEPLKEVMLLLSNEELAR
jgi:acyl dehydratase